MTQPLSPKITLLSCSHQVRSALPPTYILYAVHRYYRFAKRCLKFPTAILDQPSQCAHLFSVSSISSHTFHNQIMAGGARAALRRGENYPLPLQEGPQKGILVSVPLFHVTGMTSFSVNLSYLDGDDNVHLSVTRC